MGAARPAISAECVAMIRRTRELKACPMCGYLRGNLPNGIKSSLLPHRNGCELGDLLKRLEGAEKSIERLGGVYREYEWSRVRAYRKGARECLIVDER